MLFNTASVNSKRDGLKYSKYSWKTIHYSRNMSRLPLGESKLSVRMGEGNIGGMHSRVTGSQQDLSLKVAAIVRGGK